MSIINQHSSYIARLTTSIVKLITSAIADTEKQQFPSHYINLISTVAKMSTRQCQLKRYSVFCLITLGNVRYCINRLLLEINIGNSLNRSFRGN